MSEGAPQARSNLSSYVDGLPRFGAREACLWREGVRWRRRTYTELHRRVLACASALRSAGLRPGGAVLIQGPDGADWIEALLGTFWAGGVAVPLDVGTPDDLRSRVAGKLGEALFVAAPGLAAPPGVRRLELGAWSDAPPSEARETRSSSDERAEIMFTSGTTGDPKGVILTHRNLISDFSPIEHAYRKRERLVRSFGTLRVLSTLPLSHMFGQAMNVFLPFTMGLTVVFVPPRPREVLEAAKRMRAWGLFTVPRVLDLLADEVRRIYTEEGRLETLERRQERFADRPFYVQVPLFWRMQRLFGWRFRLIVSGGAPLPETVDRFFRRSGYLVIQGYGLTETAPIVSVSNPFDRRSGSVGRPLSVQEVKLGPGNEVLVKGPNVTPGYLGDGGSALEEGWFKTGDVGEFDDKGQLRIRGRVKEVIVTPEGENVHPGDVEGAFRDLPGVRGAAVIGLPLERGERVHVVLLLDPGTDAQEVVRIANEKLLPRQRVRGHTVWPEEDFPRTSTGKIRKGILRDRVIRLEEESRSASSTGSPLARQATGSVRRLVASLARVKPESLTEKTRLVEGLGFASLDLVELAAAFEEEYGVSLPEDRLGTATVGDLEALAVSRTVAPGRPAIPQAAAGARPQGPPVEASAPGALEAPREGRARGTLRMPRWTRLWPVRLLRRVIEEILIVPFVRFHARPTVVGLDHLAEGRPPYLIVANHRSYLDTGLLKAMLPPRLRGRICPGMTTRHHRVFFGESGGSGARYLIQGFQAILSEFFFNAWPLPETAGFRSSLSYAGELMDDGFSILIFPEGRHVPPPEMEPFRNGIGIFARELRAPVLPAYVEGTERVLPDGRYWPHRGRTRLVIGPPLSIDPNADAMEVTRLIEAAVRRLR